MRIFVENEKSQIREKARQMMEDVTNEKEYEILVDLISSLQIIRRFLGEKWYDKAGEGLWSASQREKNTSKLPPITNYLGSRTPQNYIRIINFAIFLKSLLDKTNVLSKLREYTNKGKLSVVTTDLFDSTYFELKTASYFIRNGLNVEFLKEGKTPTPDMRIISKKDSIIVECKKKRFQEQYTTQGALDSLRKANGQLESFQSDGLIALEFALKHNDPIKHISVDLDLIKNELQSMPRVIGILFLVEYTYEEDVWTGIKTDSMFIENPNSKKKPSEEISYILQNIRPPIQRSLLDD